MKLKAVSEIMLTLFLVSMLSIVSNVALVNAKNADIAESLSIPFASDSDWPMFRRDPHHTGYTSEPIGSPFALSWILPVEGVVDSSPAVSEGRVFFGSEDGKLYSVNSQDGHLIWEYQTGFGVRSSPAVYDDFVIFGSLDTNVYCLNKKTSELVWKFKTGSWVESSPTIVDGMVYIGSNDGNLYALAVETGMLTWTASLGGPFGSPAVDGDLVFISSRDGYVYALRRSDGYAIWSRFINFTWSSPTVAQGMVFIGSFYNGTFALDEYTGDIVWKSDPVYDTGSTPAYFNGRVYVGVGGHMVFCFDAYTGEVVWTFHADAGFSSSPAITSELLVIGSWDSNVYILDIATGEEIWRYATGARIDSSPAIADGRIFIGSKDQRLYGFDANLPCVTDDTNDWIFPPDGGTGLDYMDITSACIVNIDYWTVRFEMTLAGDIPEDPSPKSIGYVWGLDLDRDRIFTEFPPYAPEHTDLNVRVAFDPNWGWQGYIDGKPGPSPVYMSFSIEANTVSFTLPLSLIYDTTSFLWQAGTVGSVEDTNLPYDIAPNHGLPRASWSREVISWEYVFEDTRRLTTLKISTDDNYFQFITPDRDYGIREACIMHICETCCGTFVVILHKDCELAIYSRCVGAPLDICFAFAKDMQTGSCHVLIDECGIE